MTVFLQIISALLLLGLRFAIAEEYIVVNASMPTGKCRRIDSEWQAPNKAVTEMARTVMSKAEKMIGTGIKTFEVTRHSLTECMDGPSNLYTVDMNAVDSEGKSVFLAFHLRVFPSRAGPTRVAMVDPGVLVVRDGEEDAIYGFDGLKSSTVVDRRHTLR